MTSKEQEQIAVLNEPKHCTTLAPELCHLLVEQGLNITDPQAYWALTTQGWLLRNYVNDFDGYYKSGDELVDSINQPMRIPAFDLMQMQRLLPEYTLCKLATGDFEIMCDRIYSVKNIRSVRLADTFGGMVLQLLKNKKIPASYMNELLKFTK